MGKELAMKEKFKQLKDFNWRLFAALCVLALIPAIYQTVRTFIISSNGESGVFDIIGQMEWYDLIDETLRAFLIVPLYSVLNKLLKHDEENFAKHTFKVGVIAFALYTLFSVGVLIYGSVLVAAMNPAEVDLDVTNHYLQLETVAFMVGILPSFFNVVSLWLVKIKTYIYF